MAQVAKYAALAISIAAAIPTGGTSLLAAGVASAGIAAGATATAVAAGIAAAANIGAGLLARKPSIGAGGSQSEWEADPTAAIPITLGRTGGGGQIVYRKTSGNSNKNEYQTLTTVLSLGPIDAIEASYADKRQLLLTGTAAGAPYSNWMWEARQIGACPEASALNTGVGTKPGWTSAHKLSGLAAVQNTLRYDNKGNGTFMTEPQMLWVRRGVLCYDPRLDSTYPGGSGPCRVNDQSTWVFSKNPPIVGLTYALGWFQNGKRRGGVGLAPTSIDIASFVEAANIADMNGWTVGGNISTADRKWAALKAILQAAACEPIRDGATLSCVIQAPRVSIATIGAGDLIGAASVPRSRRRRERINGIIPKYRVEANWWEQASGTVARIAVYVAEDGGERTKEIEYPLVQVEAGQDASQPTQLAGYDVELSRERMPIVLPLKLRWIGYRTGDCIDCAIDELGLGDVQLVIIRRQLDPATGAVTLTVRTEDPAKHARVFALTGDVPPDTTFERPDRPGEFALDLSRSAHRIVTRTVVYPWSSDDNSISIEAFDGVIDDGRPISFGAQTIGTLAAGTSYGLFWSISDASWSASASPASSEWSNSNLVFLQWVATSDAGTYPGSPTPPPGSGGDGGGGYQPPMFEP